MANTNLSIIMGLLLFSLLAADASIVSAATCNLAPLAPCLSAAKKGGPAPSQACCSSVQKLSPSCLCQGVQSSAAKSLHVDIPTALGIPQHCGLKVPRGFKCAGYKVPGG
ncbi:hypothetical protein O6H91_18G021100 [Diphasiastrum complanatum]|uniref:Uncharacterized protein n=1 Tax=Diphasiastrum complanatum TaxID=34168 RepID=A0ACC2AYR9_DIPCM|nr:hypothetical protein O6H91_18G021100 [Diphasiastrum complanatum]